jgi:hypothetical protein
MQAAKMQGLAQTSYGEYTKRRKTYGKLSPSLNTLHDGGVTESTSISNGGDFRGSVGQGRCPKDEVGSPSLPYFQSGFRKERLGSIISRHLRDVAESDDVNVGGSGLDVKVCSPPMLYQSVSVVIVLGGWESQPQGEGPQLVSRS